MINTHMSATTFQFWRRRSGKITISATTFSIPPNGRTGANCLLGTKTMIPIDGPMRENVGLLGSPAFEIPRMVDRDRDLNASISDETPGRLRQRTSTMPSPRCCF